MNRTLIPAWVRESWPLLIVLAVICGVAVAVNHDKGEAFIALGAIVVLVVAFGTKSDRDNRTHQQNLETAKQLIEDGASLKFHQEVSVQSYSVSIYAGDFTLSDGRKLTAFAKNGRVYFPEGDS